MPPPPGRRSSSSRSRLDVTLLVGLVVVALTAGGSWLVRAEPSATSQRPPSETTLSQAVVICPPAGPGSTSAVASTSGAEGDLDVRSGEDQQDVAVRPDAPSEVDTGAGRAGSLVVTGLDDLAPGLAAGRFAEPTAAADCRPPVVDQWFTAAGSFAKHSSLLQLVNPDAGRAIIDVTVHGRRGVVDLPDLRGLAVPGRSTVEIDLGATVPRRDDLALQVTVTRGRASAHVLDTVDDLGPEDPSSDWLGSQTGPSRTNLMLGLPRGTGTRTLTLANPTDDEGRATVRLVTERSVFVPAGLEDLVLPPQSVVRTSLERVLGGGGDDTPLGVQVDSTVPATATLRLFVDGDLTHAVPSTPVSGVAAALLPAGDKQLVLGDAAGPGVVTVTSRDADGAELESERVELATGRGYVVDLPADTALLTVDVARTRVSASVQVLDRGVTQVRLREPLTTGLVPDVRPGLP